MNAKSPEESILSYLNKKYQKYLSRKNKLKNKTLEVSQIVSLVAGCAGVGAAVGSPLPGVGNAIGAAVGAAVGGIISASLAIDYTRKNKKLKNAITVLDALTQNGINSQAGLSVLAKKIVSENKNLLLNEESSKSIARAAMKGLKTQGLLKAPVNKVVEKQLTYVKNTLAR